MRISPTELLIIPRTRQIARIVIRVIALRIQRVTTNTFVSLRHAKVREPSARARAGGGSLVVGCARRALEGALSAAVVGALQVGVGRHGFRDPGLVGGGAGLRGDRHGCSWESGGWGGVWLANIEIAGFGTGGGVERELT
jgi:hypothetical protein